MLNPEEFDYIPKPIFPTMAQPRPLNLVQLLQFYGYTGTDPDQHITRFEIVCTANLIP